MIDSLLLIIDPLHGDKLMSLIFFLRGLIIICRVNNSCSRKRDDLLLFIHFNFYQSGG